MRVAIGGQRASEDGAEFDAGNGGGGGLCQSLTGRDVTDIFPFRDISGHLMCGITQEKFSVSLSLCHFFAEEVPPSAHSAAALPCRRMQMEHE